MKTQRSSGLAARAAIAMIAAFVSGMLPAVSQAQPATNPASRLYVSDVAGEALITRQGAIQDIRKRAVYTAEGSVIETRSSNGPATETRTFATLIFSNGTGAYFDADTRVEIRRFVQEPYTPNRTDLEVEPSISQTHGFLTRGVIGLCTSKLVAGSSLVYETPHASIAIRGRRVVIAATGDTTTISMLSGDGTVRAGSMDAGGHVLNIGQQAIIRRGPPGEPNTIAIAPIPAADIAGLENTVAYACVARRTVYFDVADRQGEPNSGLVNAFDSGSGNSGTRREIIPVEVVPTNLPVHYTISPAILVTPGQDSNR